MRAERALAWAVLCAGIATMVATSDPDDDDDYGVREYASATGQLQSEGREDAKIARLTIVRSGALRDISGRLSLSVAARVSRPAADLIFGFLRVAGDSQDAGLAADASAPVQTLDGGLRDAGSSGRDTSEVAVLGTHRPNSGFAELQLYDSMNIPPCGEVEVCTTVRDVYIRAQAPEPFSLALTASATFESYDGYARVDAGAAEGTLTMTIEVVDAP